ncbi:helix-turn-helix transcriptional regulator [Actinotignum sp. GS-2025f]|uniref:HTH cro/C1-type domain-containing protein n=1 Tax=Actinotignum schaalii FB123-CNA-2 TaxID=883067 RepID=S2VI90_9ACTO|nr:MULTISPECIES: helix-turn-helix transcriptional regulator [Actinotignum]EPD26481.1 hypothetical protein HMPREF9237_01103 [Actinotignum schaalii FB123-CNA-2]MDE1654424.1 helix-turn-helix transcriptional regulator [Actinotignum schaalii]MDY5126712.1 helix-turn-helix transcriptional regulator [Actinotignum sp. SLA_B059]
MQDSSRIDSLVAWRLAKTVRDRRESLGMSQEDLALRANLNRTTLQSLESGRSDHKTGKPSNPQLRTLLQLARALEMSAGELLGEAERLYDQALREEGL